jgi:hypothetical protein
MRLEPTAGRSREKCGLQIEHPPSPRLPSSLKSYDAARRRDRKLREEKSWVSGKPDDDDGFAALAQLESA